MSILSGVSCFHLSESGKCYCVVWCEGASKVKYTCTGGGVLVVLQLQVWLCCVEGVRALGEICELSVVLARCGTKQLKCG